MRIERKLGEPPRPHQGTEITVRRNGTLDCNKAVPVDRRYKFYAQFQGLILVLASGISLVKGFFADIALVRILGVSI